MGPVVSQSDAFKTMAVLHCKSKLVAIMQSVEWAIGPFCCQQARYLGLHTSVIVLGERPAERDRGHVSRLGGYRRGKRH